MIRIEHNVKTGKITEIKLTPLEIEEKLKQDEENRILMEQLQNEAAAQVEAKERALAKIGLTPDEVAALLA